MNPLLESFETSPFSKIKNTHYKPAIEKAIAIAKEEIKRIATHSSPPSFQNTLEALEFTGQKLDRIIRILSNINAAETSKEIQKIARDISPWLSTFKNDLTLNPDLFKRVRCVHEMKDSLNLTQEQSMLLEKQYKSFLRNGANLDDSEKDKLRLIDVQLSELTLEFGEHVLADTNAFEMHVVKETELSGLPDHSKESAHFLAKQQQKEGWIFTLDSPSYVPFMTYADNRKLRMKMAKAFGRRGFQKNENNNEQIVLEIVKLRQERAKLLGYQSHAHFILEERMAEAPERVFSFINELLDKARPVAEREFSAIQEYAKKSDGIGQLQKWDSAYYAEKLKQQHFNFDQEILKPYFLLENVIDGAFKIASRLYDISFSELTTIDKYHEEVTTYEVKNSKNELLAILYTDFHPRKGKRNGAWMTSYKPQQVKNQINERPHISIVCNFTRSTQTQPSLLTFNEVTTLFHEFGHALHGMMANTVYASLSGTSVSWDFVELPSQIFENWCYEKEALELFARHYKTGALIPMEYVEKIKELASFHQGMQTVRQLSLARLDMAWHTSKELQETTSVKEFEKIALLETQLYPDIEENCMSTSFSHIFQGGYAAGYYSYKWAEVLDADAFAYFKEKGIFNKAIATKFKESILSKGGTEKPMVLYKSFRGKKPNPNALLKRAGLLF